MTMKIVLTEDQLKRIIEAETDDMVICDGCGWKWKKSEGGEDMYMCHKCGHNNEKEKGV